MTNAVEIFEENHIKAVYTRLSDNVAKEVSIQLFYLCQKNYDEFFICNGKVKIPNFSLRDARMPHCNELSKFIDKTNYG